MLSHVTFGTGDLARAEAFYDAVLGAVGLVRRVVEPDGGPPCAAWHEAGRDMPRFYVSEPFDGGLPGAGNGSMVAFRAPSDAAVDEAHAAGLRAGGADEGAPGLRAHYAPDYYGAYLRDPDGNKVHLVHRAGWDGDE